MIQRLSVPLSTAVHAGALGALVLASCLAVGTIQPPPLGPSLMDPFRVVRAKIVAVPPPKGGAAVAVPEPRRKPLPEKVQELVQPQVVPERAEPEPASAQPAEATAPGVEQGVDGGITGGKVGGQIGGDIDGDVNGSLSGSRDGVPGGAEVGDGPDDAPARLTGDIRPPTLVRRIDPAYPELARVSRIQGRVVLEIVVGKDGSVEAVKVLKSMAVFDEAAIEAVRRWEYDPALQNGRAVKVCVTVVVDFKLR